MALDQVFYAQLYKGEEQHGTVLRTFNGRNAYGDFMQEQIDGLMYATQLYMEALEFVDLTERTVRLLRAITGKPVSMAEVVALTKDSVQLLRDAEECLEKSGLSKSANPT